MPSSPVIATPTRNEGASPSSTFSDFSTTPNTQLRNEASRSTFRSLFNSPAGTPGPKKVVMKADHGLLTCFDPADKELYDLWAPKF